MAKYVAYYRVSTKDQGKSGLGLEAQQKAVADLVKFNGNKLIAEFTEVESGKRNDRPELAKALKHCRKTKATLIVAKLDRLSRNSAFLMQLYDSKIDVRFCDLPEVEGAMGRFIIQQMANIAELEAGLISERTKKALAAAKERGQQLGGKRANSPDIREYQAQGVKAAQAKYEAWLSDVAEDLLALKAQDLSLNAMARELNAQGIPTSRGCAWTPTAVKRALDRL